MTDIEHRWKPCTKDAGDTKPVVLRAQALCKAFWNADEQYDVGDFAWPTKATGFVLQCTGPVGGGRSSATEPRTRGLTAGQVIPDGSLEWTLRVPTLLDGIQPITNIDATPPAGITIAGLGINEGTKIFVDYAGGTLGASYDVLFTMTIAGRPRTGRQTVTITEK